MSDEPDALQGAVVESSPEDAPKVEAAPVVEAKAPEPEDTDEQNDPEESAAEEGNDPPAKPKNKGVGKRIDELTRDKYDAIRRAELAEQRLLAIEQERAANAKPTAPQAAGRPLPDQFTDWNDYEAARDAWLIAQARQQWTSEQQKAETERQQRERQTAFQKRIAAFEQEHPGAWQEAVSAPIHVTPAMQEVIAESEKGPWIGHYLATHLDEAAEISRMTPLAAAKALGRIEASLSAPRVEQSRPAPSITKAPAPVPTIRPAAVISKSLDDMDMGEYEAERTRQRKAAGLIR